MLFKTKKDSKKSDLIETLYKEHRDRLYWVAYNILQDDQEAQDAVQMTFEKVVKSADKLNFDDETRVGGMLAAICRHSAIDIYRLRKKEDTSALPEKELELPADTYNPENIILSNEVIDHIQSSIRELDDKYKSVLLLYWGGNKKLEDVAAILDISYEAAKKRLLRGRNQVTDNVRRIQSSENIRVR